MYEVRKHLNSFVRTWILWIYLVYLLFYREAERRLNRISRLLPLFCRMVLVECFLLKSFVLFNSPNHAATSTRFVQTSRNLITYSTLYLQLFLLKMTLILMLCAVIYFTVDFLHIYSFLNLTFDWILLQYFVRVDKYIENDT